MLLSREPQGSWFVLPSLCCCHLQVCCWQVPQTEAQVRRSYILVNKKRRSNQAWIKVYFFSILCHKWQTWIRPSNRCRKLLICSIWLSCFFLVLFFFLVGWFFGDHLPREENICFCPVWFALRSGHPALQRGWLVRPPGIRWFLFEEESEVCHFLKKYPAPTSLISPDSKWY